MAEMFTQFLNEKKTYETIAGLAQILVDHYFKTSCLHNFHIGVSNSMVEFQFCKDDSCWKTYYQIIEILGNLWQAKTL